MNSTPNVAPTPKEVGQWYPISRMKVSSLARTHSESDVQSRAASMTRDGQLQNAILVRVDNPNFPDGWCYELVVGNGRLESAKAKGWDKLKADLYEDLTETQKLQMVLSENLEREEASPFYTAFLYQKLKDMENLDLAGLAARLDKDAGNLSRLLSLNTLDPQVREKLARYSFSMAHMAQIQRLKDRDQQITLVEACAKGDWSTRILQAQVDKVLAGGSQDATDLQTPIPKPPFQFVLKKDRVTIKVRAFEPEYETIESFAQEMMAAYHSFAAAHQVGVPAQSDKTEATPSA